MTRFFLHFSLCLSTLCSPVGRLFTRTLAVICQARRSVTVRGFLDTSKDLESFLIFFLLLSPKKVAIQKVKRLIEVPIRSIRK